MLKKELYYQLTTNFFDCYDHLNLTSVLDISQTIAGNHAEELGVGYAAFINENKEWLIISSRFTFIASVGPNERLKVVTIPHKPEHFHCDRDYFFYNEKDELVLKGSSKWVVYNREKKRILPCNEIFLGEEFSTCFAYDNKNTKLDIGDKTKFNLTNSHKVVKSELDHYHHFNNTRYLTLFYDSFDLNKEELIDNFQVDYIDQCFENDIINIYTLRDDKNCYFYGEVNGKTMFQALVVLK